MTNYDISVILPVYNDEEYVDGAIQSILNQTGVSFELIIVNDGSTDKSRDVIQTYAECENVQIITHDGNRGLASALNSGIEAASGDYIARQDADDRSVPGRLQTQYEYLTENTGTDLFSTGTFVISEEGNNIGSFSPPPNLEEALKNYNPIVHGSVIIRAQALRNIGGYDPFFNYRQDYELWTRLCEQGYTLGGIPEKLYELRRSSDPVSVDKQREKIEYALLARTQKRRKEKLKKIAIEDGIHAITSHLTRAEKADYNRRMVRSYIEHGHRSKALAAGVNALYFSPTTISSHKHFILSVLPICLSTRVVSSISGRPGK